MDITLLKGYPDFIGRRQAWAGYGSGPKSYVQLANGGDPLNIPGFHAYIDAPFPATTVSGSYRIEAVPSAVGARPTWKLRWLVAATGAEVAAATDLSAEEVQFGGFCGVY